MNTTTTSHRNLLLGCVCAAAVPAVIMPMLLLLNLTLTPDPMIRPGALISLVMGLLMTATVAAIVGLAVMLVVGFPLISLLARFNLDRIWVVMLAGVILGAAVGGSGFFGSNALKWALLCGINGAFCGAVAYWCSRSNTTVERDSRNRLAPRRER